MLASDLALPSLPLIGVPSLPFSLYLSCAVLLDPRVFLLLSHHGGRQRSDHHEGSHNGIFPVTFLYKILNYTLAKLNSKL